MTGIYIVLCKESNRCSRVCKLNIVLLRNFDFMKQQSPGTQLDTDIETKT
jgi:hypothetical protein